MLLGVTLALNLIAGLASTAAALVAIRNPQALSRSPAVDAGERFYAAMYAARSVPFGVLAALLPLLSAGPVVIAVIALAALVQLTDVAIALGRQDRRMASGAAAGTVLHTAAAMMLVLHR